MPTLAEIDQQIAALEQQIAAAQAGGGAAGPDYSAFYKSPGYQFRFDEGLRALDRSAAAKGRLLGGGYGRELMRYGQGIASSEFGNYANRLAQLAGFGSGGQSSQDLTQPGGAGAYGATATSLGRGLADTMNFGGTARASGYVGGANALNDSLGNYAFLLNQSGNNPSLADYGSYGYDYDNFGVF